MCMVVYPGVDEVMAPARVGLARVPQGLLCLQAGAHVRAIGAALVACGLGGTHHGFELVQRRGGAHFLDARPQSAGAEAFHLGHDAVGPFRHLFQMRERLRMIGEIGALGIGLVHVYLDRRFRLGAHATAHDRFDQAGPELFKWQWLLGGHAVQWQGEQ